MTEQQTATADEVAKFDQLMTDRAAGKIDDYTWQREHAPWIESVGPRYHATPRAAPQSAEEARAKIGDLQQRRIDGDVGDREYFAELDRLAPIAEGESVAPSVYVSPEVETELATLVAPPSDGSEYVFEYHAGTPDDEDSRAFDAELRSAFVDLGVPKAQGGLLYGALEQHLASAQNWTETHIEHNTDAVLDELGNRWGASRDERIKAVGAMLERAAAKHPTVAKLLDEKPWVIDSVPVFTLLDQIAQNTARRRA